MRAENWFSFVALGVLIGIGVALVHVTAIALYGGSPKQQQAKSADGRYCGDLYDCDANNRPIDRLGVLLSQAVIAELEASDQPRNPKYYERQDLRAQKGMAAATDSLVVISVVSIAVGIVGAVRVIWRRRKTVACFGIFAKERRRVSPISQVSTTGIIHVIIIV